MLIFYSLVVTPGTTRFSTRKFTFCQRITLMYCFRFIWVSQTTEIIFLCISIDYFYNQDEECLLRGTSLSFKQRVKEVGYDNTWLEVAQGSYPIADFRVSEGILPSKSPIFNVTFGGFRITAKEMAKKLNFSTAFFCPFACVMQNALIYRQQFSFPLSLTFTVIHHEHKSLLLIRYRKLNFT
jgi:hypothetical protein